MMNIVEARSNVGVVVRATQGASMAADLGKHRSQREFAGFVV